MSGKSDYLVSIPSRPRGRLQDRHISVIGCPLKGFNPQPTPWPAAGAAIFTLEDRFREGE